MRIKKNLLLFLSTILLLSPRQLDTIYLDDIIGSIGEIQRLLARQQQVPQGGICTICQESEGLNRILDCGHSFHNTCITPWLTQGNNSCPNCRAPQSIPLKIHNRVRKFVKNKWSTVSPGPKVLVNHLLIAFSISSAIQQLRQILRNEGTGIFSRHISTNIILGSLYLSKKYLRRHTPYLKNLNNLAINTLFFTCCPQYMKQDVIKMIRGNIVSDNLALIQSLAPPSPEEEEIRTVPFKMRMTAFFGGLAAGWMIVPKMNKLVERGIKNILGRLHVNV